MNKAYSNVGDLRTRRGFALVLVVVLLSLLVLLLVGLATLARVEGRVTENRHDHADARRNALVGLHRALGELQRHAGPDRCATARAAFMDGVEPNRAQWTGVWRAGFADPVWLVSILSSPPPDPRSPVWQDPVVLVGAMSAEITGSPDGDPDLVRVETVPLTAPASSYPGWTSENDPVIGRFAYWVGDESTKISVSVPDERRAVTGIDGSTPWARVEAGPLWGGVDPEGAELASILGRALVYSQLGYVDPAFSAPRLRRNYHRASLTSLAVLSDPVEGGFKAVAAIDGGNPYESEGLWLYDRVFLPTAPAGDETLPRALPAARFALRRRDDTPPPAGELFDGRMAARGWVAGAVNLNAADPDPLAQRLTWRMLLGAARHLTLADGSPRMLTDGELEALAAQLTLARFRDGYAGTGKTVGEPFRSVADFARAGLLDVALASTPINFGRAPEDPDYVSGSHLLAMLAPILTVRGDTFTIRAYGSSRNPVTGTTLAEAWCEATVQRLPDYVDPSDAPDALPTRTDNLAFGRRFIVTGFRWLTPADI